MSTKKPIPAWKKRNDIEDKISSLKKQKQKADDSFDKKIAAEETRLSKLYASIQKSRKSNPSGKH